MSAAGAGDAALVESLLASGADANAAHDGGDTALTRAASKGHLQIVRALIEAGADTNAERDDGFNALALAVLFGHSEVVRALLDGGADPSIVGPLGTTAEKWARFRGFDEIAGMLEDSRRARRQHSKHAAATGNRESGATAFFPPEGEFNVVVPLSEIGTAQKSGVADPTSRAAAESLISRVPAEDVHEEVTLVPARAARPAPVLRPKGVRPSWHVMIVALVLSVAAGLMAGTYLVRSVRSVETQTAAPIAEAGAHVDVGMTKAPGPQPPAVAPESSPVPSPPPEADSGADTTAPARNAAARPDKTSGDSPAPKRGTADDAPPSYSGRSTEASRARVVAVNEQAQERPDRKARPVTVAPRAQREVVTTRRATDRVEHPPAPRAPERSLPVSSPPASTKSKKVIQWP